MIEPALRRRLLLVGALVLLALGLPWTTAYSVPGYYSPGFCTTTYDADGYGSVSCDPGFIGAGFHSPAAPGFTLDVRVYAALMLLAGLLGVRRMAPVLLGIALTIGAAALIRNPGSQAGQLVWVAALITATAALGGAGLLGERVLRWVSRLRRRLPRPRGSHRAAPPPRGAPGAAHR